MHGSRAAKKGLYPRFIFPDMLQENQRFFFVVFMFRRCCFSVGVLFSRFAVFLLGDRPGRFCFCPLLLFSPSIIFTDILQRGPRLFRPACYASLRSSLRSPSLDRGGVRCFVRRCFVRCLARIIYADIYYIGIMGWRRLFLLFPKNILSRRFLLFVLYTLHAKMAELVWYMVFLFPFNTWNV